jgi:hypothetical protein
VRKSWYNKGNLVPNPSFEQVFYHKNGSEDSTVNLNDWTIIGKNVQVTDTRKNNHDSLTAFRGNCAIKIVRTARDVKNVDNPSEGVESDFIKVIPGNYNFSFYIRLKKIDPSPYPDVRFQKRIGKGIDIRLKFYDKNKKPISPYIYFGYIHSKLDNGFKGFAFSNFFKIKKFKWGKVRGETWYYPFSVGDVPDNCRYVKIYLGLNIEGTMWVDNVNYHFSRWNFTPLERINSMFNQKYDLTDLMIPTPKVVENKAHFSLKNKHIAIFYNGKESQEIHATISLLRKRLKKVHGVSFRVFKYKSGKSIPSSADLQIILIRKHSPFLTEFKGAFRAIKKKGQGYFIRRKRNRIFIGANQPKGFFNAATSLSQLLDYNNSILDYADITDWPDFKYRSTKMMSFKNKWTLERDSSLSQTQIKNKLSNNKEKLTKQVNDINFYAFYKINTFYNNYFSFSKRWWKPGNFYKQLYRKVGKRIDQYGNILNLAVQLSPTFHLGMELNESALSDSIRSLFSYGTQVGFDKVKKALKPALDAGAKTVMYCSDDWIPHHGFSRGQYVLFTKPDRAKFTNLAEGQAYLINELRAWLNKKYDDIRLEFVPPYYNNWFINYSNGRARSYYRDLTRMVDSSVVFVWTGPAIRSLSYDMADLHRVTKIYGRKPMIWDNSSYARALYTRNGGYPFNYPQKAVMCNIFEPFDIQYPKDFSNYLSSSYYSNLGGFSEINKIKYMTFADFSWNTAGYKPGFSLFKALIKYVGKGNAKRLLEFNDAYFRFVSTWGQLKREIRRNSSYTCSERKERKAEQQIKKMKEAFHSLKQVEDKALKKELKNKMESKINAWHKLCK